MDWTCIFELTISKDCNTILQLGCWKIQKLCVENDKIKWRFPFTLRILSVCFRPLTKWSKRSTMMTWWKITCTRVVWKVMNWRKHSEQIYLENIWVFTSRHNRHIYLNIYRMDTQASQVPSSTTMLSDGLPLRASSSRWVQPSRNCFIHLLTVNSSQQWSSYASLSIRIISAAFSLLAVKNGTESTFEQGVHVRMQLHCTRLPNSHFSLSFATKLGQCVPKLKF